MTYRTQGRAEKGSVPAGFLYCHHTARIVHALGIRKNQYIRFTVSKNKIIIKPVESNITKKDVAEADLDCRARQV